MEKKKKKNLLTQEFGQNRKNGSFDAVNGLIDRIVGNALEPDLERLLGEGCHLNQWLEVVADATTHVAGVFQLASQKHSRLVV